MLDHPKWRRALRDGGDTALIIWWRLYSWCARFLTDGEVPADMVDDVADLGYSKVRSRALRALVDASLLTRRDDGGVTLVDYLQRNPSKQQVLAERERKAKSQRNYKDRRALTNQQPMAERTADDVPSQSHPNPIPFQEIDRRSAPREVPALELVTGVGVASAPALAPAEDPISLASVREVFAEWQRVHSHDTAKLDAKRTARIRGALKLHAVDQLKLAIRGALKDDWLMGRDPRAPRKYDGLETILRDNAQIERLIDLERGIGSRTRRYGSAQPNLGKTGFESLEGHDES